MSVINKMLQELDKRHATPDPEAPGIQDSGNLAQQVRPVKAAALGSVLFWRVMAGLMVVVVGWVIWVVWQIMPRSVVTDQAYQALAQGRPPVQAARQAAVPVAAQAPAPSPAAPPQSVSATPSATPPAPAAPPETSKIDMLRLATEIAVPIPRRAGKSAQAKPADKETVPAAKAEVGAVKLTESTAERMPTTQTPLPRARAAAAAPALGRIDKRVDVTPGERAESEFRRAMGLINQGRMAEGMDGLKATLAADPTYDLARQTLVALLLESRRTDEAAVLLQDGLAINAANIGYGMLLARIYVERGDAAGALALLQKFEAGARTNGEYRAFVAALYQRLGRHAEAIEQYRGALMLSGGVGAWWVGLGISQDALDRHADATESFQRAKGTGTLSTDLLAFVDRRLKQ
jgi:MSHA biogenesis protein MshN